MSIHKLPDDVVRAVFHALDIGPTQRPICDHCDEFITRCDDAVAVAEDDGEEWVIAPLGIGRVTEVTMWHRGCLPDEMRMLFDHQARAAMWRYN